MAVVMFKMVTLTSVDIIYTIFITTMSSSLMLKIIANTSQTLLHIKAVETFIIHI